MFERKESGNRTWNARLILCKTANVGAGSSWLAKGRGAVPDWIGYPHGFFDAVNEMPKRDMKMVSSTLSYAKDIIPEEETVDFISHIGIVLDGKGYPGVLILSSSYVTVIVETGWRRNNIQNAMIPYTNIASVETDGKKWAAIEISHQGGTLVVSKDRDTANQIVSDLRRRVAEAHVPAPVANDPLDQLAKLASLRDSGALTEAEYDEQKRRLLERM
jgi:hypothetical protein